MKRIVLAVLPIVMLAACTTQITSDQAKNAVHNIAEVATTGCQIVQPQLGGAAALTANPALGAATAANGLFCAGQAGIAAATATSAPAPASVPTAK